MSLLRGEDGGCDVTCKDGMKQTLRCTWVLSSVSGVSHALLSLGASEGLVFQHQPGCSSVAPPCLEIALNMFVLVDCTECFTAKRRLGVQNVFYLSVFGRAHTLLIYFSKLAIASFVSS